MKRIFLDTNILIDYIDNRTGADAAEQIFACGFSGEALLFASSLTFANMAYIIKDRTQEEKYDALRQMAGVVEIVSLGKAEVKASIDRPVKDFEDMLQYQCAKAAGCDVIVTNDRRHKKLSFILVLPHKGMVLLLFFVFLMQN